MGGETPRLNFHSPAQFSSNLSVLPLPLPRFFYSILRKHCVPVNGKGSWLIFFFFLFFFFFYDLLEHYSYSTRISARACCSPFAKGGGVEKKSWKKEKKKKGRTKNKKKRKKERRGKYETPENLLAQRHRSVQRAWGSLKNCKTGKFTGQSGNHQMFNVGGNTLAR